MVHRQRSTSAIITTQPPFATKPATLPARPINGGPLEDAFIAVGAPLVVFSLPGVMVTAKFIVGAWFAPARAIDRRCRRVFPLAFTALNALISFDKPKVLLAAFYRFFILSSSTAPNRTAMNQSALILTAFATMLSCALAQSEDAAFLAKFEKTFEACGPVPAKDFVPETWMSGTLHSVRPLADNDGLRNTYFVDSPEGVLEVTGTPALFTRIREIYALDHLGGLNKTEEFANALANAGKAKVASVIGVVRDPFGTIKNVPKGASRFFGRIGEGMKGKSDGDEKALAGLTGVTKAKAKLAAELGVNPFTTNEELQRELTNTARAMAGGGLVINAATSFAGGGAGAALTAVGVNQSLQEVLVNSTPEDLRIINRKKLFALGVDRKQADEFLMHPWFSPWQETITTDALVRIGVNPSAFLSDAVKSLTADDAFFFQRVAQILARYHAGVAPLRMIRFVGGIITAIDRDGTLVVPVSLDYAIWGEQVARRTEEFKAIDRERGEIKALALWADGRLSERLCDELRKRGIDFRMNALADTAAR